MKTRSYDLPFADFLALVPLYPPNPDQHPTAPAGELHLRTVGSGEIRCLLTRRQLDYLAERIGKVSK